MRAVYYESFKGDIVINNVPDPEPVDHGVVLKVNATGICRSDWHGWMGHDPDIVLPHVPGHELAGEIVAIGSKISKFKVGERVTVPFVGGCGACQYCQSGDHQVCPNQFQPGFTHWGSFAEYVGIHFADTNLVKLPDTISDDTAACLGCRFATSYRALVDQANIKSGKNIVIFGCGGVGLSAIMIAKAYGLKVIAIDIDDSKLSFAKLHGADICINSQSTHDLVTEVIDKTNGGVAYTLDAFGNQSVIMHAIKMLQRRGTHVQVGLLDPKDKMTPIAIDRLVAYELEIKGSHGMQAFRYEEMLNLINEGKLQPQKLITNRLSLEESIEALENMDDFTANGVQVITTF